PVRHQTGRGSYSGLAGTVLGTADRAPDEQGKQDGVRVHRGQGRPSRVGRYGPGGRRSNTPLAHPAHTQFEVDEFDLSGHTQFFTSLPLPDAAPGGTMSRVS